MTTPRDPDRLIDAYLAEGPDRLPDRAYDALRGDIDRTRQRVVSGPWRDVQMNNLAKLAIGLAAAVVVAIVGLNLAPIRGGIAGVAPSPTPDPSPSVAAMPLPAAGPLTAGTYQAASEVDQVPFSLTVSDGWSREGWFLTNDKPDPYGLRLTFVPIRNLYSDPCLGTLASPEIGSTVDDLAAGLMALPGTQGPTMHDTQIGGRDAKLIEFTVHTDYACALGKFHLWRDAAGRELSIEPPYGDVIRTWIVDVDGDRFVMAADIHSTVSSADRVELQLVADSVTFP